MTLRAQLKLDGFCEVRYTDSDAMPSDLLRFGSSLFPRWQMNLIDGTAANKAQKQYHRAHTILTTASVTIDLTAAATERFGNISFSIIRWAMFRIRTPAASTKLDIGNAATNIFSAWHSSSTATFEVRDLEIKTNPVDGWTVDATHKNLLITNPSAGTVVVDVWIVGY